MASHFSEHSDQSSGGVSGGDGVAWPLMTPGEVAVILQVDSNTLARWANDGKLTTVRTPGGHRRYLRTEVLGLAARRSWPSSPPT